ncbi:MAG: helix-turn-helix transcriptional regulator [Chromatiales bacterium]|jgi:AraC-like DNA-binding protein
MAFAQELIDTLKRELRTRRVTYADIARELQLSESSIKRLFSEGDMSLSRLETICALVELDIAQLATRTTEQRRHVHTLTREQEETLVGDEKLLLLTVHLIYGWSYARVMAIYDIDPHQGQRMLVQLDRMQIIELLPENRVRIRLSPDFQWLPDGPIQHFFEREVQSDFFSSNFTGDGELRLVMNGWMSLHGIRAFHENMRRLAKEFDLQIKSDRHVPVEERRGTTMVVAVRPWSLEMFEKHVRK